MGPNHTAFQSIRKALDLRRKQGYAEDVSFAHLFEKNPEVRAESLRSKYASTGASFRTAVEESLSKGKESEPVSFDENLRQFLVEKGITVAWVQRGEFESMPAAPTVTYHPLSRKAHEPNSGLEVPGFKPVDGSRGQQYTRVMVDKEYVQSNPTLVVRPCEAGFVEGGVVNKYCEFSARTNEMEPIVGGGGGGGSGGGDSGGGDSGGDSNSLTDNTKFEVFVDDFQCRNDTDSWLGGGPEIRIFNAEPQVESVDPTEVSGFSSKIYVDSFSGDDCDANEWHSVGTNWTSPWEKGDVSNGLLVYDHDDVSFKGSAEFNMTYDGKVNGVDIYANATAKIEYRNDYTWGQIPIARTGFVENNATNCNENGMRDGKCIRGIGSYARITFGANILE